MASSPLRSTFRKSLGEGAELHYSDPAEELGEVSAATLEAAAALSELFLRGDIDPAFQGGWMLERPGRFNMSSIPTPGWGDKRKPEVVLFPLLDAFCKFLDAEKKRVLRGAVPALVRVTCIGPEAPKTTLWHCDVTRQYDASGSIFSRALPNVGRLAVGLDTLLRESVPANLRVINGEFVVRDVVPEPVNVATVQQLDGAHPSATVVTPETGSIVEIRDPGFAPDPSTVKEGTRNVVLDLNSTCLHAGTPIPDALRVGLQCWYTREVSLAGQV